MIKQVMPWWKEVHCEKCKQAVKRVVTTDDNNMGGTWFWIKCHGEAARKFVDYGEIRFGKTSPTLHGFVIVRS